MLDVGDWHVPRMVLSWCMLVGCRFRGWYFPGACLLDVGVKPGSFRAFRALACPVCNVVVTHASVGDPYHLRGIYSRWRLKTSLTGCGPTCYPPGRPALLDGVAQTRLGSWIRAQAVSRAVPHFKPRVKRRSQSRDMLSFRLRYPLGPPAAGRRPLPEQRRADSQVHHAATSLRAGYKTPSYHQPGSSSSARHALNPSCAPW